ncbi:MAG: ROK family protein [Anaerolineae bacterium]
MEKGAFYVGVDLGGTSLTAAVIDVRNGQVLGESKRKTRAELGALSVVERLAKSINKAITNAGLKRQDIQGVGVGVPGPIDPQSGTVIRCANMGESWDQFELGNVLSELIKLPIVVDNDVNVGAVGESAFGAGKGVRDMVAIFVGTGVGGGIIWHGKLHTGARNSAGEVGHMVLAADVGPVCGCGERGCAEALCSRTAIEREIRVSIAAGQTSIITQLLQESDRSDISAGIIGDAYDAGDAVTIAAVNQAQHYLGLLVASCVNFMDPQAIVVGGGVLERMGDPYLEPVREVAQQHYINKAGAAGIAIVRAALGDYSGAIGAAVLAKERLAAT